MKAQEMQEAMAREREQAKSRLQILSKSKGESDSELHSLTARYQDLQR
jgi:hypothetical protein